MSILPGMPAVATPVPPVQPEPVKWTERAVLDVMHRRFCVPVNGQSPRYALAEHLRLDPTWGGTILDAVTVDTWGSSGYALDGYEVKVSRGDLRREILSPEKAGAWDGLLDTFTIVAPSTVLHHWPDLCMPESWGVLSLTASGLRYLRKPKRAAIQRGAVGVVSKRLTASLARSVAKTSTLHCSRIGCRGGAA